MGNFATVFKELRIRNGYTQDEAAEGLNLSRSTVSMYENGNRQPDFEILERIADFFKVDVDYLLGRTDKIDIIPSKTENEPSFEDIQSLIARNGKKLTLEQKQHIIKTLLTGE